MSGSETVVASDTPPSFKTHSLSDTIFNWREGGREGGRERGREGGKKRREGERGIREGEKR